MTRGGVGGGAPRPSPLTRSLRSLPRDDGRGNLNAPFRPAGALPSPPSHPPPSHSWWTDKRGPVTVSGLVPLPIDVHVVGVVVGEHAVPVGVVPSREVEVIHALEVGCDLILFHEFFSRLLEGL